MVAKISSGNNLFGVLKYNLDKVKKEKGQVLLTNNIVGIQPDGTHNMQVLIQSFETNLSTDHNVSKPIIHISLNPDPKDLLSDEQLSEIAGTYLERLGYGNQPYMIIKHSDINREHLHIVTLRVDENGKRISDSFEHRRSKEITKALEQEYGLYPADKKQLQEIPSIKKVNYEQGDIKRQLSNTVKELARSFRFQSLNEFKTLLSLYNIATEEIRGEAKGKPYNGLVYYATNDKGEKVSNPFKSSLFGKSVGFDALTKKTEESKQQIKEKGLVTGTKAIVWNAMKKASSKTEFEKMLYNKGINVVFRENDERRIYGVTFIDHNSKMVLNGSRSGKEFSANVFNDLFQGTDKQPDSEQKLPPFIPHQDNDTFPKQDFSLDKNEKSDLEEIAGGLFDILPVNENAFEENQQFPKPFKKKPKRRFGRQF